MATVLLTAVGSAIAGPVGGLVGSFLGASVDRAVFGGSSNGSGRRATDLAVQSSAYGEPIPRLYGRIRAAGNLIWSPGIKEATTTSGGKRRSSTNYTYSASFAVALAAREIGSVARIWADGKLLRNSNGQWIYPAVMRIYTGRDEQSADPLIVAVEGAARAPAYRGLAYAVFEDLPLADYGNRIPNLTFEIIADTIDPNIGIIAADMFDAAKVEPPAVVGSFPSVQGFAAAHSGSLRSHLQPLVDFADLSFSDSASGLVMRSGTNVAAVQIDIRELGSAQDSERGAFLRNEVRGASETLPDSLAIGFFDPARDYQLGLQRAVRRSPIVRSEQRDIAAVLDAANAKALAETLVSRVVAARSTIELSVPWRYVGISVGDALCIGGDVRPWRIRSRIVEAMIIRLQGERLPIAPRGLTTSVTAADAGRSLVVDDEPNGPSLLEVMDLPPLAGAVATTPRLWVAAAGVGSAWRRPEIEVSLDDGNSYQSVTAAAAATPMGTVAGTIGSGVLDRWDTLNVIEVVLANDAMWLESRTESAVLGGANLALVGDEIVQFTTAIAIAPRRFRLSGLLRGRRGSELAVANHSSDERFVLLDAESLVPFDPPVEAIGRILRFRAGAFGATQTVAAIKLVGRALRPLSPVQLRTNTDFAGGLSVNWIRRSRAGFAWIDGVDAPLGEEREAYVITVEHAGFTLRSEVSDVANWSYSVADRIADGTVGVVDLTIKVAQASSAVGLSDPAVGAITLKSL